MSATFANLLAANLVRVHKSALGRLGDEQEAREVAQEALTRAWAARERYDSRRPFYPWLATIVRNACRDARARRRNRAVSGLDTERLTSPIRGPWAALDAAQAQQRVRTAMEVLDESHREIIVLRHFEDLSYAEIAAMLDIAEGTVMSRLFRARRALIRVLEEGV